MMNLKKKINNVIKSYKITFNSDNKLLYQLITGSYTFKYKTRLNFFKNTTPKKIKFCAQKIIKHVFK